MHATASAVSSHTGPLKTLGLRVALPLVALAAGSSALRRWSLRFGATGDEAALSLPGDDRVPRPDLTATRAVTIAATPERVWPWIAQLGQGRGGFYSYTWLENLAGAKIKNADEVIPLWQDPAVGEQVNLAPGTALDVVLVDPGRALVLVGGIPIAGAGSPFEFSWAFVLLEAGDGTCRLVVRERYGYTRRWSALMVEPTEMVSFLMTQRMLRGIKERAEHTAGHDPRTTVDAQVGT